jgi:hypothetical protein
VNKKKAIETLKLQIEKIKAVQDNDYINLHYQNQYYLTNFFGKDPLGKDPIQVQHLQNIYEHNFNLNLYINHLEICCDTLKKDGVFNNKKNIVSNRSNFEILGSAIAILLFAFGTSYKFNEIYNDHKYFETKQELKLANQKIALLENKIKNITPKK